MQEDHSIVGSIIPWQDPPPHQHMPQFKRRESWLKAVGLRAFLCIFFSFLLVMGVLRSCLDFPSMMDCISSINSILSLNLLLFEGFNTATRIAHHHPHLHPPTFSVCWLKVPSFEVFC